MHVPSPLGGKNLKNGDCQPGVERIPSTNQVPTGALEHGLLLHGSTKNVLQSGSVGSLHKSHELQGQKNICCIPALRLVEDGNGR